MIDQQCICTYLDPNTYVMLEYFTSYMYINGI